MRHVERERRWEFLESSSLSDKRRDRLGDIDEMVILKRILKWDMTVGLRIWSIGFVITVSVYPLLGNGSINTFLQHEHATIG
jgi:hypothetical protein